MQAEGERLGVSRDKAPPTPPSSYTRVTMQRNSTTFIQRQPSERLRPEATRGVCAGKRRLKREGNGVRGKNKMEKAR